MCDIPIYFDSFAELKRGIMQIEKELVLKLAELSKLEFSESEIELFRSDFQKMLNFVDKLNEVDVAGVEPLIFITEEFNKLRQDEAKVTISQQDALQNAPQKDTDYFRVPKVLGAK
ncbi:MAG: Asp-tRNA(Asn)/Glu-tRNA(Gln) amidotransferase subunit GatC [Luteibaculaceae bacterium]